MTDEVLLDRYRRAQQRRGLSEATQSQSRYPLRAFSCYLGGSGLLQATRAQVEEWLDLRGGLPQTRLWNLSMLAAFYKWALREELTERDPTAAIERPRLPRRLPRPVSDDDLSVALELADERMRCWLLLGAYAGLRVGEITGLSREDILDSWSPPTLRVRRGKGGHERMVALHPVLLGALRVYGLPRSGPLWIGRRGPLTVGTVIRYVSRFFADLGIPATSHQNRHWFGTHALRAAGGNLRVVAELMGHASSSTTDIYTLVDQQDKAVVVKRLAVRPVQPSLLDDSGAERRWRG